MHVQGFFSPNHQGLDRVNIISFIENR